MTRRIPNLRQIKSDYNDTSGIFEYGPLVPGYAITLGTALRRVLLSSVPGCGIYALRIEGVSHEYTTIPGMREDVVHFIQNLKLINFELSQEAEILESVRCTLNAKGPIEVTTDMIECPGKLLGIRETKYLCYLNSGAALSCEIFLKQGEGYVDSKSNRSTLQPGLILVDNLLNAVKRVSIDIEENVQYRDHTDYEILRLGIDTDGSVNPSKAIEVAVSILVGQLSKMAAIQVKSETPGNEEAIDSNIKSRSLEEFNLPLGTLSALKEYGIETLGHLLSRTRESLYEIPRVGARKISDIENILTSMGLSFKDSDKSFSRRKSTEDEGQNRKKRNLDKGDN